MNWWLRFRRRRALEEDLADEIAFHKHMRSHDEAPPPFGNETLIRERMRELWTFDCVETTLGDVVIAIRGWRKNPEFAITVIASLALGIGAVIAIFTAADDLLFRPLPYRDPGRLVMLLETTRASPATVLDSVSPNNFLDWKSRNSVFEDMAYIDEGRSVFGDGDQSQRGAGFCLQFRHVALPGWIRCRLCDFSRSSNTPKTRIAGVTLSEKRTSGRIGTIGRLLCGDAPLTRSNTIHSFGHPNDSPLPVNNGSPRMMHVFWANEVRTRSARTSKPVCNLRPARHLSVV